MSMVVNEGPFPPKPEGSPTWTQSAWFIDPANSTGLANDGNAGNDPSVPVRTYNGGVVAKWGTTSPVLAQATTFTWMSSQPDGSDPVVFEPICTGSATNGIVMKGVLNAAQKIHAGALASVTAKNRSTPQLLQADLGFAAPIGTRIINTTAGKESVAYVYKVVSGTVFALTQPVTAQAPPNLHLPVEVDTWADSDTFELYTPVSVNIIQAGANVVTGYPTASEWISVYAMTILDPAGIGSGGSCYIGDNACLVECVVQRNVTFQPNNDIDNEIVSNCFLQSDASSGGGVGSALAPIYMSAGALLSFNGTNTAFSFIFDTVVDAGAAPINIGFAGPGYQIGKVYIAGTVNVIGSTAGAAGAAPDAGTIVWGPGTLNVAGTCRCYYGSGAGAAVATFKCAALELNGQSNANAFNPAAGTFGTALALTPTNLDGGFASLAVNVGGACFAGQDSM